MITQLQFSMIVWYMHDKYPNMSYRNIVSKIKKVRTISINQTFADKLEQRIDSLVKK